MKYSFVIAVAIIATACTTTAVDSGKIVSANATLKDGSSVKGEFCAKCISGSTIFSEKLKLDPALVKSLDFVGTNGEAKVALVNDDKFAMTVANEDFTIKSILGDLKIPRASFKSLRMSQRSVATGAAAEEGLVFYCTFDDEAAITSPVVGPNGKFQQGSFVPGKVGQALQTTVCAHNADFELPANFFGLSGCIEFWAKILNPSSNIGDNGDPRLYTITHKESHGTFSTIDIVSNNGAGNSGFSTWTLLGNMASLHGCRALRYDDLFPGSNSRDWHHYAVVWDQNGISGVPGRPQMALLVDGKYIPDIQNHVRNPKEIAFFIATPSLLCFTHDTNLGPNANTKSPFLIDEFKIWNFAKTEF